MTIQTKGAFLWLGAGIGGAAIAGPLVPFGLFLLWTSRQCAATAEERGWIEPLPPLPEVEQAQQVLVESVALAETVRLLYRSLLVFVQQKSNPTSSCSIFSSRPQIL